jgi:methyl-accepting chemotaxis protein
MQQERSSKRPAHAGTGPGAARIQTARLANPETSSAEHDLLTTRVSPARIFDAPPGSACHASHAERTALDERHRAGGIDTLSSAIAQRIGRSEIEITVGASAGDIDQEQRWFRTLGVALKNGGFLFLGVDAHALDEFREFLVGAFGWGAVATLVLAVLGSMAMCAGVLRRVEAINRASERIMAGELDRRLPTTTGGGSGRGDEFDRLDAKLNVMLDRIEVRQAMGWVWP